ncbi:MAG TPA: MarR family transcriptional regulator [Streptosporangiales bacterium]
MDTLTDTTEELAADLIAHSGRLMRLVAAEASVGMSSTQGRTLARLEEYGPVRVTDLAAAEHVAQPTMTALVDRMERAGYVRRQQDAADGRVVLVAVTDAGRERRAQSRRAMAEVLVPRLRRLSGEQRERLTQLTRALAELCDGADE